MEMAGWLTTDVVEHIQLAYQNGREIAPFISKLTQSPNAIICILLFIDHIDFLLNIRCFFKLNPIIC